MRAGPDHFPDRSPRERENYLQMLSESGNFVATSSPPSPGVQEVPGS